MPAAARSTGQRPPGGPVKIPRRNRIVASLNGQRSTGADGGSTILRLRPSVWTGRRGPERNGYRRAPISERGVRLDDAAALEALRAALAWVRRRREIAGSTARRRRDEGAATVRWHERGLCGLGLAVAARFGGGDGAGAVGRWTWRRISACAVLDLAHWRMPMRAWRAVAPWIVWRLQVEGPRALAGPWHAGTGERAGDAGCRILARAIGRPLRPTALMRGRRIASARPQALALAVAGERDRQGGYVRHLAALLRHVT